MESVLIEIIDRLHPWVINGIGIAIAGVLVFGIGSILHTWKKVSEDFRNVISREDRLLKVTEQLDNEKTTRGQYENMAFQLQTAIDRLCHCMEEVQAFRSKLRSQEVDGLGDVASEFRQLATRILENLATALKTRTEDNHRCGLWFVVSDGLLMVAATSGFPASYLYTRKLGLNDSVAGRAFRKKTEEVVQDIDQDPDYTRNPESKHNYKSLLCFPIAPYGVVTIDAKRPFDEAQISIARLYVRLISSLVVEFAQFPLSPGRSGTPDGGVKDDADAVTRQDRNGQTDGADE